MTPEEQKEFKQLVNDVRETKNEVVGQERFDFTDGISFRLRRVEEELRSVQSQIANQKRIIRYVAISFAVGLLFGAVMFGLITWKEAISIVK